MYYIPSAPIPKVPQAPSLLRVISYGAFLCDRTHSLLSHSTGTRYLADIPLRLVVATLSESEQCAAQLIVRVDRFKELSDRSEYLDSPAASKGDSAISLSSWRSLSVKPGNDSLLVDMGLIPNISQETLAYITLPGTCDDDMDVEVARNGSVDASVYTEAFQNTREEIFIYDDSPCFEPHLDVETWPSCTISRSRDFVSTPDILSADASISASASSFFEALLASSSFSNLSDAECLPPLNSDTSALFPFPVPSSRAASFDSAIDDSQLIGMDLCSTQDLGYNISLQFSSVVPPGAQLSFELDFPLLPSSSDAAEFIAESFGLPAAEAVPSYSTGPSFKIHLDTELSSQSSHVNTISLASFSSAQSFMIPTLSSMENLMHISLDSSALFIDSPSFSSISSIRSLCQLPTCASVDDLMRIQPPACYEMEADNKDDDDAFGPLPPGIPSPFHISDRLNAFKENLMELRYMHHSLPCLEEERDL